MFGHIALGNDSADEPIDDFPAAFILTDRYLFDTDTVVEVYGRIDDPVLSDLGTAALNALDSIIDFGDRIVASELALSEDARRDRAYFTLDEVLARGARLSDQLTWHVYKEDGFWHLYIEET